MSFGQKVLKKYGWNEGDGLGKNSDGIREALRPRRKANVLGFGYKLGSSFKDNWWENVYDKAASNIVVKTNVEENTCSVTKLDVSEPGIQKKRKRDMKRNNSYFIKESEAKSDEDLSECTNILNDEEIFNKCGGRTAHKGARHGLTLSGKLFRVEKQDQQLLKKRIVDDMLHEKKEKKKKKII